MTTNVFAGLNSLDVSSLRTVFPSDSDSARNGGKSRPSARALRRRATRRTMVDLRGIATCTKLIERLPERGESIHMLVPASFDGWLVVPSVLKLAAPAVAERLLVCTLGFNRAGTASLIQLLDNGAVRSVTFVCSHYFKSVDGPLFEELHAALTARKQTCLATRSHCKLILFALDNGERIVVESSSNLRSCRGLEQTTLTSDRALFGFHAGWIDELVSTAKRERAR